MNEESRNSDGRRSSIERAVRVRGEQSRGREDQRGRLETREYPSLTTSAATRQKVGEIMVEQGTLTADQVEQVLQYQQESGLSFGESASRLGLADSAAIRHALAMQFGYPSVPPGDKSLSSKLVVAHDPDTDYSEAFRGLRANLLASWAQGGSRSVAVVGADAQQDYADLVGNIGITFAQLGKRTLLIDTNFRQPRLNALFGIADGRGLSTMLATGSPDADIVQRVPFFSSLSVLASGPIPPNVQELLTGDRFKALLRSAREQYEAVFLVTAPWGAGTDAESVARSAGSALVIAKRDETRRKDLSDLVQRLERFGVNLDGCVLVD